VLPKTTAKIDEILQPTNWKLAFAKPNRWPCTSVLAF